MSFININRNVTDVFYRYKMPAIIAKCEGKGNGVRTVIKNLSDISQALNRPVNYILKFFGHEIGTQTQEEKHKDTLEVRYIINGTHDSTRLQVILDSFIKKFVLCTSCDNPETILYVKGGERILLHCIACGLKFPIDLNSKVFMKLSSYISRNPPQNDSISFSKDSQIDKIKVDESIITSDGAAEEIVDIIWNNSRSDPNSKNNSFISSNIENIIATSNALSPFHDRVDNFVAYINKLMKENGFESLFVNKSKVKQYAEYLDLGAKTSAILCEVIFTKNILHEIPLAKDFLIIFLENSPPSQKHVLGVIEMLLFTHQTYLLPRSNHIFKSLYDNDLIDESTFLRWNDKPSYKYVNDEIFQQEIRNSTFIFLNWLREAEEASDNDDYPNSDSIIFKTCLENDVCFPDFNKEIIKESVDKPSESDIIDIDAI